MAGNSRNKIQQTWGPLFGPPLYSPYTAKPYEKEFVSLDMADAVTLYNSLGCNSIDIWDLRLELGRKLGQGLRTL